MINIDYIQQIKNGDLSPSVTVYSENIDYVIYLAKLFGIDWQFINDFKQIAYLALLEAAKAYDFSFSTKQTFKKLWKSYVMKQYLDFRLDIFYSIKVSRSTYSNIKKTVGIENSVLAKLDSEVLNNVISKDLFFDVEGYLLNQCLWDIVKSSLNHIDFNILFSFYKKDKLLEDIAKDLRLSLSSVKKRKAKALKKLAKNNHMRVIAFDYYNLRE